MVVQRSRRSPIDGGTVQAWPLLLLDHAGERHSVVLSPGQMVLYEGARLNHGRMRPLAGQHYDNMFVHFKPRGAWYRDNWTPDFQPQHIFTREDLMR